MNHAVGVIVAGLLACAEPAFAGWPLLTSGIGLGASFQVGRHDEPKAKRAAFRAHFYTEVSSMESGMLEFTPRGEWLAPIVGAEVGLHIRAKDGVRAEFLGRGGVTAMTISYVGPLKLGEFNAVVGASLGRDGWSLRYGGGLRATYLFARLSVRKSEKTLLARELDVGIEAGAVPWTYFFEG